MSRPIDEHGGIRAPLFHRSYMSDGKPRLLLFVEVDSMQGGVDVAKTWMQLDLSRLGALILCVPEGSKGPFPDMHPLIQFAESPINPVQVATELVENSNEVVWCLAIPSTHGIYPAFWEFLRTANHTLCYRLKDTDDKVHMLWSITKDGPSLEHRTVDTPFFVPMMEDSSRIQDGIQRGLSQQLYRTLQHIRMDVSETYTPLCQLATAYGTDKSTYNLFTHRHPYTAVYDMMFRQLRPKKLGEVGVLKGSSIHMWKKYFPGVQISAFDIEQEYLKNVASIPNVSAYCVDAGDSLGLRHALEEACSDGSKFELLIEDASHRLEHQLIFLREAIDFVAPGGCLVIEDIFREIPMERFEEVLADMTEKVGYAVMVTPEHKFRWSPDWENDRILFVWKRTFS